MVSKHIQFKVMVNSQTNTLLPGQNLGALAMLSNENEALDQYQLEF